VFVLVAAVVLVIVATVALARGEAASIAAGTGQDVKLTLPHEAEHEPVEDVAGQVSHQQAGVSPVAPQRSRTIT
jgi:hypothetical protein